MTRPAPQRCPAPSHRRRRSGFTLVELITSMVVLMVLLMATSTTIFFAGRLYQGQGVTDQTNLLSAADVTDQICDDMNLAMTFNERTATSVCFTVPDRVSNGTPNQVRYAWTGVAGGALTRQFCPSNSPVLTAASTTYMPVTLLSSVNSFSLNTLTRQMGPGTAVSDSTICSYTPSSPTGPGAPVNNNNWIAQQFLPTLSVGVSSYTITRIQLVLQGSGNQSAYEFVRVVVPNVLGEPTGTVLEQEPIYDASLSTTKFETINVYFKSLTGLSPVQPLCIVIGGTITGSPPINVQDQTSLLSILGGSFLSCTSNNGGSSWSLPSATTVYAYNVYGTVP